MKLQSITRLTDDHPFNKHINLIELVEKVRESGFTVDDFNYLLCHRFDDPLGKYRSKSDAAFALLKELTTEITHIEEDTNRHSDYSAITDDLLRQKLSEVLPIELVNRLFEFWNDNIEFSAKKRPVPQGIKLDPEKYHLDMEGMQGAPGPCPYSSFL